MFFRTVIENKDEFHSSSPMKTALTVDVLKSVRFLYQHWCCCDDLLYTTRCCLATRLPVGFFRRSSNTWDRLYCPSSLFMVVPCCLIFTASLIHRLYLSASLPKILASSQSMMWSFSITWSVMADLLTADCDASLLALVRTFTHALSASALCSSRRLPNFLPVSPT